MIQKKSHLGTSRKGWKGASFVEKNGLGWKNRGSGSGRVELGGLKGNPERSQTFHWSSRLKEGKKMGGIWQQQKRKMNRVLKEEHAVYVIVIVVVVVLNWRRKLSSRLTRAHARIQFRRHGVFMVFLHRLGLDWHLWRAKNGTKLKLKGITVKFYSASTSS